MEKHKSRLLSFLLAAVLVFGFVLLGIGTLGQLNLMPQFDNTSGIFFTAILWIGMAIVVPIAFLKGLGWVARGRDSDHSRPDMARFADDGPFNQNYKVDPVDRFGHNPRSASNR